MKTIRKIEKGVKDSKIVEIAEKEERTILTQDMDFGELYYFSNKEKVKIAVARPSKQSIELINKIFRKQLPKIQEREYGLYILRENKIRELK